MLDSLVRVSRRVPKVSWIFRIVNHTNAYNKHNNHDYHAIIEYKYSSNVYNKSINTLSNQKHLFYVKLQAK